MNQCLRCQGPCSPSSLLCDQCCSLLQENDTHPHAAQEAEPGTIGLEEIAHSFPDRSEQSLNYLNAAAKRIAEADPEARARIHSPRPSRLTPLRDISAEIQRDSTPLPSSAFNTFSTLHGYRDEQSEQEPFEESPWMIEPEEEADQDASERDMWANHPDPLLVRRFPSLAESLSIEEEDISRILGDSVSSMFVAVRKTPRKYLRLFCLWVAICVLIALVIDSTMLALLGKQGLSQIGMHGPPVLMLSKSKANYGDTVVVQLRNFSSGGTVALSRNIGEQLLSNTGSSLVVVNTNGASDVPVKVALSWTSGIQTIEAEDVHTHYTASALLMLGSGQPQPANLSITNTNLDFGSDIQGASTIKSFILNNTGNGLISWSASSQVSWLLLTPAHGIFSGQQAVQVAVDRSHLKPGNYSSKIIIVSNVSKPITINATMSVQPIPKDAGAVMSVAPPVLSFTAIDGGGDPASQTLTISNLGHKDLYWTITREAPQALSQNTPYMNGAQSLTSTNWLQFQETKGKIAPGSSDTVTVSVRSGVLLPGTYTNTVNFGATPGHSVYNGSQKVAISLTIQPSCGVTLSTGSMSFTTVSGQAVSTQSLSLMSSASCRGAVNWSATSSQSWLSLTPTSGTISGSAPTSTTAAVNVSGLKPGSYSASLSIVSPQSSQTVLVQLIVQNAPAPSIPDIEVSPLSVNFNVPAGTNSVPGQALAISNTGQDVLYWQASTLSDAPWLVMASSSGTVQPGSVGSLLINVSTASLTPGTYSTQIKLAGLNAIGALAGGSPQEINVTLTVNAPCVITVPSSSALLFNATQSGASPAATQVMLTASGGCAWPIHWGAMSTAPAWLSVTPASGTFTASGQSAALTVTPVTTNMVAGTNQGSIVINATDANGQSVGGGALTLNTVLTILQPCMLLSSTNGTVNVSAGQGTTSLVKNIPLSVSGNCILPLNWTASVNTTSGGSWLNMLSSTGSDSGSGSTLSFQADATNLTPGTYSGTISFVASDASNTPPTSVPQITVQLVVTGYTVTGNVTQCDGTASCTPTPSAGTTVTLTDTAGNIVTAVTGSDGSYQFTNVANGTYSVSAPGQTAAVAITVQNGSVTAAPLNLIIVPATTVPVVSSP